MPLDIVKNVYLGKAKPGSGGGITPTGTINITQNGVVDVTNFANADVNVPVPTYYIEKTKDANGKLVNGGSSVINLTGVTDIGNYVLYRAYESVSTITGNIDLSSLTKISGDYALTRAFYGCTGITSVDFSSLTEITGKESFYNTFNGCTGITSVNLSSLKKVTGQTCFYHTLGCVHIQLY